MIVFTDSYYSGSLPASEIATKSYILYVHRVLHPPLSKIPVTRNLMQDSIRDFFISNVKNIPQNKTIMWCVVKNKENQGHSVDRKQYAMGKKAYMNA